MKLEMEMKIPNPRIQHVECEAQIDGRPVVYRLKFLNSKATTIRNFKKKADQISSEFKKKTHSIENEDMMWEDLKMRSSKVKNNQSTSKTV